MKTSDLYNSLTTFVMERFGQHETEPWGR